MTTPRTEIRIDGMTATLAVPDSKGTPKLLLNTDLMDHMVVNTFDPRTLGEEKDETLAAYAAATASDEVGGKNIALVPPSEAKSIPGFIPVDEDKETRLRQATRTELDAGTQTILRHYPDLVSTLDNAFAMKKGTSHFDYETLHRFMEENSDFIPTHMDELKIEGAYGKYARFNQQHVTAASLVSKTTSQFAGILRSYSAGMGVTYLSDETILSTTFPLEKFPGETQDTQIQERFKFMLAYLMNKSLQAFPDQNHFMIIAAANRVSMYEGLGFKRFQADTFGDQYRALMRFQYPTKGNRLWAAKNVIQENAQQAFQKAQAMKTALPAYTGLPGLALFAAETKATPVAENTTFVYQKAKMLILEGNELGLGELIKTSVTEGVLKEPDLQGLLAFAELKAPDSGENNPTVIKEIIETQINLLNSRMRLTA